MNKRILILGSNSFAAKGLVDILTNDGHEVVCFGRGPVAQDGNKVTGPILEMATNPFLGFYDLVINYIVLKDGTIADNERFISALIEFCEKKKIPQLIHLSSVSVYDCNVKKVTELSLLEQNPLKKGSYGSLKVIADLVLKKNRTKGLKITYVRPGFILGSGVVSPIIGMGFRCGKNILLQVGSSRNVLPITTRVIVNEAIRKLCSINQLEDERVVLIADENSPTRYAWLTECCRCVGTGTKVVAIPVVFWKLAGLGGEVVAKLLRLKISPWTIVQNACRKMSFSPQDSGCYLNMSFACDWKRELVNSFENQNSPNHFLTYSPNKATLNDTQKVSFIGYGGIVKQRHLGGLKVLGFRGSIDAYDLRSRNDAGQKIQAIADFKGGKSDLWVVATPGHIHNMTIPLLKQTTGPVLIEKPLCYSFEEYNEWLDFEKQRESVVTVCHNYRFKNNMQRFHEHLNKFNSGRLLHVDVEFQSPPVSMDSAGWRKKERQAKTLLMDYGLHFLDIACMFENTKWDVIASRFERNANGETSLITGLLSSQAYDVSFMFRQGFQPRRCRIFFTFQNYGVSIGFFPDTFVPHMSDDSAGLYNLEAKESRRALFSKITDKLTNRNSDLSHASVLAMTAQNAEIAESLSVSNLSSFYYGMFELMARVYGGDKE